LLLAGREKDGMNAIPNGIAATTARFAAGIFC
jgi:hypothetical protein